MDNRAAFQCMHMYLSLPCTRILRCYTHKPTKSSINSKKKKRELQNIKEKTLIPNLRNYLPYQLVNVISGSTFSTNQTEQEGHLIRPFSLHAVHVLNPPFSK